MAIDLRAVRSFSSSAEISSSSFDWVVDSDDMEETLNNLDVRKLQVRRRSGGFVVDFLT